MIITDEVASDLLKVAKAAACSILGGPVGDDYSSWADDVAQDTMVALLERDAAGQLANKFVAISLCKTIAYRRAITWQATEQRRREIESEHGDDINRNLTGQSAELLSADPLEILAYDEMRDRLDGLSPLLYSTTSRHYIEGLSVAEIAEADGVTEAVIYKRLQRARDMVRGETDA
jgi:RNA polymerase sigma factor (sigma-70 family)